LQLFTTDRGHRNFGFGIRLSRKRTLTQKWFFLTALSSLLISSITKGAQTGTPIGKEANSGKCIYDLTAYFT
jgi:hypothetical protein